MQDLLSGVALRAGRYLDGLDTRPVAPPQQVLNCLSVLDEPLPERPADPESVIDLLDRIGSPATVATAGGRFFGFVHGGCLPAALAANWLAGAWDQNAVLYTTSPIASRLEEVAQRWLAQLLKLPEDCGAAFATGATMANFTALAAARNTALERLGWDVEADGLFGAPPLTVVVSEETHPSVHKALGLLGLGRRRVVRVPVDGQGRMRAEAFPRLEGPAIVCVQAGNVNTGSVDPVGRICELAHPSGSWVHVDGAFGLWAQASPTLAGLVAGVEQADSWATDAHKWLNVPYDSGLAFVRGAARLSRAMSLSAAYIPEGARRDPGQFTPELSRRARGVEIWAALRSLGRAGLAGMIDRTCAHARRFAEGLRSAGCEILNEVILNQVLVSFGDAEATLGVIERIQRDGTCWCGGTSWQGRVAMRISVASWATTEQDVERSLQAILRARDEILKTHHRADQP
ncbi:MAG: aspartate aminotransferase family protein [Bryobacterales bacterium]|nr:aspartate aminotransferase family protein [Bryobacterales bacterium]